jgi:NAD(P)-dependent dehydrogenase (short-subunit alcohol dehydrogenase family)
MSLTTDRWVLITGANRGLGRSLCGKFLALNHNVAAVSRSGQCADALGRRAADPNGARVMDFRCDLARRDEVAALIEDVSSLRLGVIVCNAAIYTQKPFAECTVDEVYDVCEINVWSHLRLIKGLEGCLDHGSSIVFINSIGIAMPADKEFAYLLSKKMLAAVSDGLQFHFGKRGVSILNVLIGGINTDMAKGREGVENFIDPDEAAHAIVSNVFLGSSVRCRTIELLRKKY